MAMVRQPKNIQWWWYPQKPLEICNVLFKTIEIYNYCKNKCWETFSLLYCVIFTLWNDLKGKLGDFFLFVQSFYWPKTKTSFNRQFSPKRPKLVKNQAKGSEIHQIRTKWHPSYCGNPSILSSDLAVKISALTAKTSNFGAFYFQPVSPARTAWF